jgi:hypothetical protein
VRCVIDMHRVRRQRCPLGTWRTEHRLWKFKRQVVTACKHNTRIPAAMGGETSNFSIWLAPEEDSALFARLQVEIRRLSEENGGVPFSPHVTLIGGIVTSIDSMISKTQDLALNLKVRGASSSLAFLM